MKIAIIGGGIGGFATLRALHKQFPEPTHSITVYESYADPSSTSSFQMTLGVGLGLAPNGIRALASIFPEAVGYIEERGFAHPFYSFRNSTGELLGRLPTGSSERYGHAQRFLSREDVHRALMLSLEEGSVQWNRKLQEVTEVKDGVELVFDDGQREQVDLLIGADGIKSVVAKTVHENQFSAVYEKSVGIGGFIPISCLPQALQNGLKTDAIAMTFGASGFFGYCRSDSRNERIMWWSNYDTETPAARNMPPEDIRRHLLAVHNGWTSPYDDTNSSQPVFRTIIDLACNRAKDGLDPIIILPKYIMPSLPNWATPSGRIILLGDAAHALPSNSGQGASTAIEDAVALAMILRHFASQTSTTNGSSSTLSIYEHTARAYETIRKPRLAQLLAVARRRADNQRKKGFVAEKARDWLFWVLCKLPESINDRVYTYDIERVTKRFLETGENVMVESRKPLPKILISSVLIVGGIALTVQRMKGRA